MMEPKKTSSLRPVAFVAVVFSTVAITACLIAFPLVFQYVQVLQANVQGEVEYCKSRTLDMWKDMIEMLPENTNQGDILQRVARQTDSLCCTCQQGESGPDGAPGKPGLDGKPATEKAKDGSPGPDAELHDKLLPVPPQCPCRANTGPQGAVGPIGSDGPPGSAGNPGADGNPGISGSPGPAGPPGQSGMPGPKGPPGPQGKLNPGLQPEPGPPGVMGRAGPPGQPGPQGKSGNDGEVGAPGSPGIDGPKGLVGAPGPSGKDGEPGSPGTAGSCDTCPAARLAPGYFS